MSSPPPIAELSTSNGNLPSGSICEDATIMVPKTNSLGLQVASKKVSGAGLEDPNTF